ncbi:hypothetical protein J2X20_003577 [Pelomonas saccharophila]|uniref:C-type lysozyme inhibitor domain-containing protein n=1 Tax=Roseateles saccharophilus TaxID=304 RepID=A0ABU1YPY5_ROSSA|nr:hypothetical protein [Roseateles saccharophilus]MDR7270919.1 hypothetical protein [Roseateles saccharophilus]
MRLPVMTTALLAAAGCASAQVMTSVPPTLRVCQASDNLTVSISHDASGTPVGAGISATSGTHECDVQTQGQASAQPDGSWRFDWADGIETRRYRATVRRAGDAYTLALEPARCGTLALPATATLPARRGQGCESRVDRDAAFVQFWQQLREAVAGRDGDMLQRLSLPQLFFSEDPDVKAPAAIIHNAAPCLAIVTTTDGRSDIGRLLQSIATPRLDMPPLSRRGENRVSAGDAMTVLWTPKGWRLEWFNASRAVFSGCKGG